MMHCAVFENCAAGAHDGRVGAWDASYPRRRHARGEGEGGQQAVGCGRTHVAKLCLPHDERGLALERASELKAEDCELGEV